MDFRKTAFFILIFFFGLYITVAAQQGSGRVSLSGVVVDEADLNPISNVTIKNASLGAAFLSDTSGFFTFDASPGDTLIFEAMLYSPEKYIVPEGFDGGRFAIIEAMHKDKVLLDEVLIKPFPTERQFQRAFLQAEPGDIIDKTVHLDANVQEVVNDPTNMQEYISNYNRHYATYIITREAPPNNFLNPIRWSKFIRDWREGRFTEDAKEKLEGFPGPGPGEEEIIEESPVLNSTE